MECQTEQEQTLVKVMTDQQIESLRRQIVAFTSINEQLFQIYNSFAAYQQHFAGQRLGDLFTDPLLASWGRKMTIRQKRWAPTPSQLKELDRLFNEGNVTPKKEKIQEITTELSQLGKISEANTYNWFQNRRARYKRKQLPPVPNIAKR